MASPSPQPLGFHSNRASIAKLVASGVITAAQLFLASPKSWRVTGLEGAKPLAPGTPVVAHSIYLANPASANPEVREKTAACLQAQLEKAALMDLQGLVIHSGQAGKDASLEEAYGRWLSTLEAVPAARGPVPLLLENTAGGFAAPGRSLESFSKLFHLLRGEGYRVGTCIDTCHAWAGRFGLRDLHKRLEDALGEGPSVVHLNGSTDPEDCGRDHHSNLTLESEQGRLALSFALQAACPVILETPAPGAASDLLLARRFLDEGQG